MPHTPHDLRRFPVHAWKLEEEKFLPENATLAETLFSLANGYIGTRGTFEEAPGLNPATCEGTYLNGVYVREKIFYEENAHGFATHNNKMVQVPDGKAIRITVDGEALSLKTDNTVSHRRTLDFRVGMLDRETVWKTASGKQVKVASRRLTSFKDQHLLAIEYSVTPVGFSGDIVLESLLDAAYGTEKEKNEDDPRAGHLSIANCLELKAAKADNSTFSMLHHVRGGEFIIHTECRHVCPQATINSVVSGDAKQSLHLHATVKDGETLTLYKFISYHNGRVGDEAKLADAAATCLAQAVSKGFAFYADAQRETLERFWENGDITIAEDPALQQGVRFNLFQIYQSAGRDGLRNIGAKGLTGPGYDGHYFWDTEIYVIPFFVYTEPAIARSLLEYRYSILDASRARARDMSHKKGALYSWRTIGGEECSAFFPAGTAQYHINAAVAYAIRQYFEATQDWDFMHRYGAEILFETARIWSEIGHFSEHRGGQFCINEVTGPDEYSAMVDNNFYTNAMARMHLRTAAEIAVAMQKDAPEKFKALSQAIGLEAAEIERWQQAAERMYLPYDEKLGINPQDDGFLLKPRWDFENTPKDKYPLLLHFHPLVIYRHQVLKQADVVLAMALLDGEFPEEQHRRNLEYYAPITTHDSTLSTCIYSIESSRAGKMKEGYGLFEETVRMDIDNLHHNTEYGLHMACMAGSWMSIVKGFGGLSIRDGQMHFHPRLPEAWKSYSFHVLFRGSRVRVSVEKGNITYSLTEGNDVKIYSFGTALELKAGIPVTVEAEAKQECAA